MSKFGGRSDAPSPVPTSSALIEVIPAHTFPSAKLYAGHVRTPVYTLSIPVEHVHLETSAREDETSRSCSNPGSAGLKVSLVACLLSTRGKACVGHGVHPSGIEGSLGLVLSCALDASRRLEKPQNLDCN